jgi:hypothetical protein
MTHHEPQLLWRTYETLPPQQKTAIRIVALIGDAIQRSAFVQVLAATRMRTGNGKAWSGRSAQELLDALRGRGLLEPDFTCIAAIRHRVAVDAAEGDQSADLLHGLARSLPRSDREQPKSPFVYYRTKLSEDGDLFRRVRLAIYANDQAEFVRLSKLFARNEHYGSDAEEHGAVILTNLLAKVPGDLPWLERRAPAIRDAIIASMATALVETGAARSDSAAVVDKLAPDAAASPAINKALLWCDILAGRLDTARGRVAALGATEAVTAAAAGAAIDFLIGQNARAVAGFRSALKQLRKLPGKRRSILPGEAGIFHVLALLRERDAKLHNEIRGLLTAAWSTLRLPRLAYRALESMLELVCGNDEKAKQSIAQTGHLLNSEAHNPLASAVASLATLHVDSEAACKRAAKDEAAFDAIAAYLPVVGRIHAEVLAETVPDADKGRWRVVAAMRPDGVIAFTDIIGFKPKWERAFDRLAAFLQPAPNEPGPASAPQVSKRLVFLIDPDTSEIEALEQALKGYGWTPGRPVAMKRLFEQYPKLDYVTAKTGGCSRQSARRPGGMGTMITSSTNMLRCSR